MNRVVLTDEQRTAVRADEDRLFVEAAPGAGKTTVAVERYGVLRFNGQRRFNRAIIAVSFTRSATGELHRRVRSRWGPTTLSWPHRIITIDTLICNIVEHLLRLGIIQWPAGHTAVTVLDDWSGHRGYRWLAAGSSQRVATLDSTGHVTSRPRRMRQPGYAIGSITDFNFHLSAGLCTHEVIRQVLSAALGRPSIRDAVSDLIASSVGHLVVDEVFDANQLDLALVNLVCEAGVAVTLIGDPWQALYGFRGARPDLVPELLTSQWFASLPLSQSFRFKTDEMKRLGSLLREGRPVQVATGDGYDVMLASQWDLLWQGPDNVLPLSFGRTVNKTDAAAIVLLDHLVYSALNQHAIFLPEALLLLGLDPDRYRSDGPDVLGQVVDVLRSTSDDAPLKALRALRESMKDLGAPRRPPSGSADGEQHQLDRLASLAIRVRSMRSGRLLVPGMTIHQAKGREWRHVGVRLSAGEIARLSAGLDRNLEADRALYVALTRASDTVRLVE